MNFSTKVALVTGGASGIGFSCAKELLQNGAKGVVITDIKAELGLKAVDELGKEFGEGKVLFVETDVSDKLQFEDAFKKSLEVFGNLDILINNAGICNDKEWEREIAINLQGTINGVLLGIDNYLKNNRSGDEGIIVNIASVAAFAPVESFPIYTATKHGIIGLTKAFGAENHYKRSNVKIMAVCPGATKTNIFPKAAIEVTLGADYASLLKSTDKFQGPEAVGKAVVHAISNGKTGSLWIVEEGEYHEIHVPKVESIKYQ